MKTKLIFLGMCLGAIIPNIKSQSSFNLNTTAQGGLHTTSLGWAALDMGGGTRCTALGHWANRWCQHSNQCVAVGSSALYWSGQIYPPAGTINYCTAIGFSALYNNHFGAENTAAGSEALSQNYDGSYNNATGYHALFSNTNGSGNNATGAYALQNNNSSGSTLGEYNTAFGHSALSANTGGVNNVAVGTDALSYNKTGSNNVALGFQTLMYNTTGNDNVATGYQSMYFNLTGYENTTAGIVSLANNQSGYQNEAFGSNALRHNETGYNNIAFGNQALYSSTTGNRNIALGNNALYGLYPGLFNNPEDNIAIGNKAMQNVSSNSSSRNVAIGSAALSYPYGPGPGYDVTTVGAYSDENGNFNNATALGLTAVVNANDKVRLGNSSVNIIEGSPTTWSAYSDGRFKSDVKEDVKGLEFIKKLRPVVYNFDTKKFQEFLVNDFTDSLKKIHLSGDFEESTNQRRTGFIAQEVEKAANESGYDFSGLNKPATDKDNYSLCYSLFVVPLVKAIQEQQEIIKEQNAKTDKLISENELLDHVITNLTVRNQETTGGLNQDSMKGFEMSAQPNPFNMETTIHYTLPLFSSDVRLIISTLNGEKILNLPVSGQQGRSEVKINSEKLIAGMYLYSIVADGKILGTKRLVVAK